MRRSSREPLPPTRLLGLLVAALAMGVYVNTLGNGFALDDVALLVDDTRFHGVERAWDALFEPYWYFPGISASLYRPVAQALFAIQWDLWGGRPLGFHAVNVALHGAVTLLVFLLLLRTGVRTGSGRTPSAYMVVAAAGAGAAVFAVHPVHVEAVANVVGQSTLLASLFSLLACHLFLRETPGPWLRAVGVALLYLLGLGAKEIAVTLPGVLFLLAAFGAGPRFGGRGEDGDEGAGPATGLATLWRRLRRDLPVYGLCALALILYLAVRLRVQGGLLETMVEPTLVTGSTAMRVATSLSVWPEYLRLLLFPRELVVDYSPGVLLPATFSEPIVWLGALLGAAALAIAAVLWGRGSLVAPGIFWFALVILPVSNLLFPVGILLAERTLYLPSVGLALVVAGVAEPVVARLREARRGEAPRAEAVAGVLLALLLAGWVGWAGHRTWVRNPVWASTRSVLEDLVEHHPESWRARAYVADRLLQQGRRAEALALFESALELAPGHPRVMLSYAQELHGAGRYAEAEEVLRETVELVPGAHAVQALLASSLLAQGKPGEALEVLDAALEHRPDDALFHRLKAYAHGRLGRWEAARNALERSLELSGEEAGWDAYRQLAAIFLHLCREEDADAALERARAKAPPELRESVEMEALRKAVVEEAGGDPCGGPAAPADAPDRSPSGGPPGADRSP